MPTRPTDELKPWPDDTPLMNSPDVLKDDGMIEHLIEYLLTVHKRFGNTCVTTSLQWGATASKKRSRQAARIAELEAENKRLCGYGTCMPGCNWHERNNSADCDCGWYDLRATWDPEIKAMLAKAKEANDEQTHS